MATWKFIRAVVDTTCLQETPELEAISFITLPEIEAKREDHARAKGVDLLYNMGVFPRANERVRDLAVKVKD